MGAPVAGVSAGALIALEIAVLDANEAGEGGAGLEEFRGRRRQMLGSQPFS